MVENPKMSGMIPFPCCPKEKVVYYQDSHGHSSHKCPTCGKFVIFDWDQHTAVISGAARGASQKYRSTV